MMFCSGKRSTSTIDGAASEVLLDPESSSLLLSVVTVVVVVVIGSNCIVVVFRFLDVIAVAITNDSGMPATNTNWTNSKEIN